MKRLPESGGHVLATQPATRSPPSSAAVRFARELLAPSAGRGWWLGGGCWWVVYSCGWSLALSLERVEGFFGEGSEGVLLIGNAGGLLT